MTVSSENPTPEELKTSSNVDVKSGIEEQNDVLNQAKDEAAALTDKIQDGAKTCSSTQEAGIALQQDILSLNVESLDQIQMKQYVAVLKQRYQALNTGIESYEGNEKTKKNLEHQLQENIDNLNQIEGELNRYSYSDLSTFKARIGELSYYFNHYEQVRQIVALGGSTSDVHVVVDSKSDARKEKRMEKKDKKYQEKMNELLKDAAITSLRNDDMERYEEYLEAVINGQVEPSTHPFFRKHQMSMNLIARVNPSLYTYIAPSSTGKMAYTTYCERTGKPVIEYDVTAPQCKENEWFADVVGDQFADVIGRIRPSVESNPRQKEARSKAGSLLALGGSIIMGVKLIKNIFSKHSENPNKWWKAAGWGAGLLALTHTDDLSQWIQDAFNWHPAEKTRILAERFQNYGFGNDVEAYRMAENYVGAPIATVAALHFIPVYELTAQEIIRNGNNGLSFNYDNYKNYINKNYSGWDDRQKQIILEAGEKLNDDKLLNDGLRTFGINTKEDLLNMCGKDKKKQFGECEAVQKGWENCCEMFNEGPHAELFKEGIRVKNPEDLGTITEEYKQNKDKTNELILKWMREGKLEVNDNSCQLADMLSNENIDIEHKTIKGFVNKEGKNIEFSSYGEMFRVVRLTERIKNKFKGNEALNLEPFHIDSVLGNMEFNDTEWYEIWKNETKVLKSKTMEEEFPTINGNKQAYADYLNSWWLEKSAIDLSGYPMIKDLGLSISSVDEAQNLNNKLLEIKTGKIGDVLLPEVGCVNPYIIKGNDLAFVGPNGESDAITIIENLKGFESTRVQRQKLLNYLNNKDNHMFVQKVDNL